MLLLLLLLMLVWGIGAKVGASSAPAGGDWVVG